MGGVTAPDYSVDVGGDSRFREDLYIEGDLGVGTTSPARVLHIRHPAATPRIESTDDTNAAAIHFINSANTNNQWQIGTVGGNNGEFLFAPAFEPTSRSGFKNASVMAITTSGNVGIGLTSPGEKLEIRGGIGLISRVTTEYTATSDNSIYKSCNC
jgi:hypothetical protein